MTAAEYINGLRELADWLEQNQEAVESSYSFPDDLGRLLSYTSEPEKFAEQERILGPSEEIVEGDYYERVRAFGPIRVQLYTAAETIARKVTRTEVHEVEAVKWERQPSPSAVPGPEAVQSAS